VYVSVVPTAFTPTAVVLPTIDPCATPDPCLTAETQDEINACAIRRAEEALSRLRQALKRNPYYQRHAELADLQREWEDVTERECRALFMQAEDDVYVLGPTAPVMYADCMRARTRARYAEMKGFLCASGLCPCVTESGECGDCPEGVDPCGFD
jgi:uncharacterized protein YecT (DUF1311 family)